MLFLKEIYIENFKSFTSENITFNKVTCVVGANESGKSNLLDAISHLSPSKQMIPFTPDDLRIGAPDYPIGEVIIKYSIVLSKILLEELYDLFPNLEYKVFYLTKKGIPQKTPEWGCNSYFTHSVIPDLIKINQKNNFLKQFSGLNNLELSNNKKRIERGWFINNSTVDLRKTPYKKLLEDGIIELLKGQEKIVFICKLIKEKVLKNIKIFQWRYKEEDFLQENVSINELIQTPNKYRTISNMLYIAGWKKTDFAINLLNQTSTVYSNLLGNVKRNIDSLIRNQWSSHKNLHIELVHRGEHLSIHLHEPGSSTPPEFRSDGLKWFLTFLINFRAQNQTTSNYILLVDEPGLYLHPRGQKDVLMEIGNLSKNNQIIYTTHQTFLIDKNKQDRVRIITRITDRTGRLSLNPFYASKVNNKIDTKSILTDRLLREALGFKVSDISPINEKNILVEGVFDRDILLLINEQMQIINLNDISIISCGRASEIAKHASLYKHNDLKILCFYDSDQAGISAYKNNDKVAVNEKSNIRYFISDINYETMEDLIPDRIFDVGIKEWAKKWRITLENDVNRPRLKNLEKYFNAKDKIEMKQNLEDIILENVTKTNTFNDFDVLKNILVFFDKQLS